jgi:ABC-2 type transport system permease protein
VAHAAFAAIGVGLGALVRNLVAGIVTALAWLAVVETFVGQLLGDDLSRWLPFRSAMALGLATPEQNAPMPAQGPAALALIIYATAFAMTAVLTTVRRDVS